jgi:hypothetical protein
MEEQPEKFASLVLDFFLEGQDAYLMQKKG